MVIKYKSGFTLIELLVVIAIIGILASVVLASLNSARDKGADAAVKSDFKSISSQMAIFYDNNGSVYTGGCLDTTISDAMVNAQANSSGDSECVSSDTEWAVWANLRYATTSAWCVDSTGRSMEISAQDSTTVDLTVCP